MLPNTVLTKATRRPRPLKLYPGHKISKRYMRARLNRRVLNSLKRVVPNIAGKKNVTEYEVLMEAASYIDQLHSQLASRSLHVHQVMQKLSESQDEELLRRGEQVMKQMSNILSRSASTPPNISSTTACTPHNISSPAYHQSKSTHAHFIQPTHQQRAQNQMSECVNKPPHLQVVPQQPQNQPHQQQMQHAYLQQQHKNSSSRLTTCLNVRTDTMVSKTHNGMHLIYTTSSPRPNIGSILIQNRVSNTINQKN